MKSAALPRRARSARFIRYRLISLSILSLCLLLLAGGPVFAHPLGNFTVNRYSGLTVEAQEVRLFYVVDMAEIPAFRARQAMDTDGDGTVSPAEASQGMQRLADELMPQLALQLNGQTVSWQQEDVQLAFPEGQGGLKTLRLELSLLAPLPEGEAWRVQYQNDSYAQQIGWQEIVIRAGEGVELLDASAPQEDISDGLRVYPEDLLQSPPALSQATAGLRMQGSGAVPPSVEAVEDAAVSFAGSSAREPFAELITRTIDGPSALLLVLLGAFVWGAAHALSPGHGKTIVAAYLVGARGTAQHALFLGLTTTVTHTAGVFALGFLTLFASRYILPETLYPWLSLISGLLVVGIGFSLIRNRFFAGNAGHSHSHDGHEHSHEHPHEHPHEHEHPHGGHTHSHGGHTHSHGGHTHSHLPPGAEGEEISWRSLLGLGISGGLAPCPSALVVMLGAIALGKIGFGLLLIVIFSLGLASVLTIIGVLMVHAGKLVKYVPESGRLLRLAPVGSAVFIILAGAGITVQALMETGLLQV